MTEEERAQEIGDAILSIPAPYANKIYSTITPAGMRLSFVEHNVATEKGVARSAVFLSFEDVEAMIELLHRQMALVQRGTLGEASATE